MGAEDSGGDYGEAQGGVEGEVEGGGEAMMCAGRLHGSVMFATVFNNASR